MLPSENVEEWGRNQLKVLLGKLGFFSDFAAQKPRETLF
jgi:hypothetical protein